MYVIADIDRLVADGVISIEQPRQIQSRAQAAMVTLGINAILCFGVIAATAGLIFFFGWPMRC